jgi:type I restriction enzyme S subunit
MSNPRNSSNSGATDANPELVRDVQEANAQYLPAAERQIPKGYKQTEVGVIPEDWDVTLLKEAGTVVDSLHQTPSFSLDGYPMVRVTDIKPGNLSLTAAFNVSQSVFMNFIRNYKPKRGDIVLSRVGSYGVSSFVETDEPFCMGQKTVVIDCKKPSRFLYYVLNSKEIRRQIEDASFGTGYKSLSLKNINGLKIPLPPTKAEQEAIAEALSDADALIEALEQLITKKRQLKQGTMQELLTGKRRLPGFSGEWTVKKFGDLVLPRKERIDPRKDGIQEFCVELEHIGSATGSLLGSTVAGESASMKTVFHAGDVLFGKLRAYLRKYWFADKFGVCSTEIWALTPIENQLLNCFLFQVIQTNNFIEVASSSYGTHMPRSDWSVVKQYEIPFPSTIEEQTAIAQILTDMDAEIAELETKLTKARAVKQGMMQQLLTGRIRLL